MAAWKNGILLSWEKNLYENISLSIHNNRFCSLVRHYRKNGLTLRVHGNAKRLPSSVSSAVKFIKNTAEEQALLLPGCVPGLKQIDLELLPSNLTKHGDVMQTSSRAWVKSQSAIPNFVTYESSSAQLLIFPKLKSMNIARAVVRNLNIRFKVFLKKWTKHTNLAHSMEMFITLQIPIYLFRRSQFISRNLGNFHSLAFVVKQSLTR